MKKKETSSTKYGRHIPHNPTQKQLDKMSIYDLVAYSRYIGIDVKEILLETIAVRQEDIEYEEDRKAAKKKNVKPTIKKKKKKVNLSERASRISESLTSKTKKEEEPKKELKNKKKKSLKALFKAMDKALGVS